VLALVTVREQPVKVLAIEQALASQCQVPVPRFGLAKIEPKPPDRCINKKGGSNE
jgi:hypothetical protein